MHYFVDFIEEERHADDSTIPISLPGTAGNGKQKGNRPGYKPERDQLNIYHSINYSDRISHVVKFITRYAENG